MAKLAKPLTSEKTNFASRNGGRALLPTYMSIVKQLSKLPSLVEYQGCTFILCFGRDCKKGSDKSDGISLWYRLDSVDSSSVHYQIYNQSGSWQKPDYGLCNFLVLYEYVNSDKNLIKNIDEIEQYLMSLNIDL